VAAALSEGEGEGGGGSREGGSREKAR
jgi:hypothetical protein